MVYIGVLLSGQPLQTPECRCSKGKGGVGAAPESENVVSK